MYERIARWYTLGLWSQSMVAMALEKGLLTRQQYENILEGEE